MKNGPVGLKISYQEWVAGLITGVNRSSELTSDILTDSGVDSDEFMKFVAGDCGKSPHSLVAAVVEEEILRLLIEIKVQAQKKSR